MINVLVCEDPFYDEDGVMIDEDGEFEEPNGWFDMENAVVKKPQEELSPFATINS